MRFTFTKCHGSGNDFPLIDARTIALGDGDWAQIARSLADRAGPVGGDGLLLLTNGDADHAFGMRMFNSDGSEAETCLNGLRCVARAGFEALGIDRAQVMLKTSSADVVRAEPLAPQVYAVRETAAPASLDARAWPLRGAGPLLIEEPIEMLPSERRFTAVSIPNPHLISFVEWVDDAELAALGALCEAAPDWLPNRANISFVEQRGGDLFVRTFERGVGLTDSCGSAMAASCYVACLTERTPFDVEMTLFNRGGLVRGRAGQDAVVTLTGNATFEWRGTITIDPTSGETGALEIIARHDAESIAWQTLTTR